METPRSSKNKEEREKNCYSDFIKMVDQAVILYKNEDVSTFCFCNVLAVLVFQH